MNKKFKFLGAIASVMAFVIAFGFPIAFAVEAQNYSTNESYAIVQYNKILDYFGRGLETEGGQSYPDYYGGSYIDTDTGHLVVQVTELTDNIKATLTEVTENDALIFEKVDFSYNYLNEVAEQACSSDFGGLNVNSAQIDEQENKVLISAKPSESAYSMTQIISVDNNAYEIVFEEADFREEASLECGQKIYINRGMGAIGSGTLGFPMKKRSGSSYLHGFVTSYHTIKAIPSNYPKALYSNSLCTKEIGIVKAQSPNDSSGVDAVFVETSDGYTATYDVKNDSHTLYDRGYYSAPQNTTVYMSGAESGLQTGKVTSTNAVLATKEKLAVNCYSFSYYSEEGDSGAPVYANAFGEMTLVAMHRGSKGSESSGDRIAIGVPIKAIIDYLGVSFDY